MPRYLSGTFWYFNHVYIYIYGATIDRALYRVLYMYVYGHYIGALYIFRPIHICIYRVPIYRALCIGAQYVGPYI